MKPRLILILIFSLPLFLSMLNAQNLPVQKLVPMKWIDTWLLFGPFPNEESRDPLVTGLLGWNTDFLEPVGGELNPKLKAGSVVKYPKGSAKCVLYSSPDSVVDFSHSIDEKLSAIAYAFTEIEADESKIWFISISPHDGGRLFVNGEKVWQFGYPAKAFEIDTYIIPVHLKKGKNTILLKMRTSRSTLQLLARFLPFSTGILAKKGEEFRISINDKGEASLTSDYSLPELQQLIQTLDIEVLDYEKKSKLKESGRKDFFGPINTGSKIYQPYTAILTSRLKTGETIRQEIPFLAGEKNEYTLFSDKKTNYSIVLDPEASESERWAATELQQWLNRISGADFPILELNQQLKGPQIIIGFNETVRNKTGASEPDNLDESYRYITSGPDIIIYGGKQRGTMYGVMSFLENEFGCRWYTPTVSVIPEKIEMKFSWIYHTESPGIRVRNNFYFGAFDPIWAARNKNNGRTGYHIQPGGVECFWAVHTFFQLIHPDEFFDIHPEYFSMINGKRSRDLSQLCLTNPDVLRILTERIKKQMRETPEYLIYDVSQNDWYNACQCNNCQAIAKKEGSESGPVIWFVNQVAEAVEEEFPDKFIGTLAYQYTRKPPKTLHPRKNVVVRLCPIEACVAHDLKSCSRNQSFMDDMKIWSSISTQLYIWDYVVNFGRYIMPYPNFYVLQPNIKTFQENKAIGIMEQAAYQSHGGEFAELKTYLISRLLWNPDCDVEDVINDFMYGFYGKSGRYIRQYFDLLHNSITPETHMHIGLTHKDKLFSEDLVQQSLLMFEKAIIVADNEDILKRVEIASLPVLYLKCKRTPALAREDGTFNRFNNILKREGITHLAEYGENFETLRKFVESAR